jgi:hypothetical protein
MKRALEEQTVLKYELLLHDCITITLQCTVDGVYGKIGGRARPLVM